MNYNLSEFYQNYVGTLIWIEVFDYEGNNEVRFQFV